MCFYAISLQPLITHLNGCSNAKQCWFADDATGVGLIEELKEWWDVLNDVGPTIGYSPNAKKCWLITRPDKEETARKVFAGTAVNLSSQGQRHLGAVLGSREYFEDYVNGKVGGEGVRLHPLPIRPVGGREYVCTPCLFGLWGEYVCTPCLFGLSGGGSTFAPPAYSACGGSTFASPAYSACRGEGVRLHPLPIQPVGGGSTFAPPA